MYFYVLIRTTGQLIIGISPLFET